MNPPEASVEAVIDEFREKLLDEGAQLSIYADGVPWLREKLLSLVETTRGEGLEKLIEECGEAFDELRQGGVTEKIEWQATAFSKVRHFATGSTPAEAVQNLLKALNGERV